MSLHFLDKLHHLQEEPPTKRPRRKLRCTNLSRTESRGLELILQDQYGIIYRLTMQELCNLLKYYSKDEPATIMQDHLKPSDYWLKIPETECRQDPNFKMAQQRYSLGAETALNFPVPREFLMGFMSYAMTKTDLKHTISFYNESVAQEAISLEEAIRDAKKVLKAQRRQEKGSEKLSQQIQAQLRYYESANRNVGSKENHYHHRKRLNKLLKQVLAIMEDKDIITSDDRNLVKAVVSQKPGRLPPRIRDLLQENIYVATLLTDLSLLRCDVARNAISCHLYDQS